jgi:hypothetical protein
MRGVRAATNCSRLGMLALSPTTGVKTGKAQNRKWFPVCPRKRASRFRTTPSANPSRTPPSRHRASRRSRASNCSRETRRPAWRGAPAADTRIVGIRDRRDRLRRLPGPVARLAGASGGEAFIDKALHRFWRIAQRPARARPAFQLTAQHVAVCIGSRPRQSVLMRTVARTCESNDGCQ